MFKSYSTVEAFHDRDKENSYDKLKRILQVNWLTQLIRPKIRSLSRRQEIPDNLWKKCERCEQMLFSKDLLEQLCVCRHCGFHLQWPVLERLKHLFDGGRYQLAEPPAVATDPLGFRDQKKYVDRLKEARQKTGLSEAILVASGKIQEQPVVGACFAFSFIGGSMGMAVGESLIAAAHLAIAKKACLLIVPASGGARMQEGILSLMQMPRSIIALELVKEAGLPVIALLTNPTTGGVAASFASLADITFAEPGAIIGFTGARVIQETMRQQLPDGFQTAEFQKTHGFIDSIEPRCTFPETIGKLLKLLWAEQAIKIRA